jgi:hypothetical protein
MMPMTAIYLGISGRMSPFAAQAQSETSPVPETILGDTMSPQRG